MNGRTNEGILVLMVQISSTRYVTHDLYCSSTHVKLHNFFSDLLFVVILKVFLLFQGAQNESLPYVYYTPSYGYTQTPYNPYNPYIPGAMIGVDGQQYYTIPPYQNSVSSPAYAPFVVQPDVIPNSSPDSLYDTGASINRPDGRGLKYNLNSASGAFPNTPKTSLNQMSPLTRLLERPRGNVGPSKQGVTHGSVSSGRFPTPAHQVLLFPLSRFTFIYVGGSSTFKISSSILLRRFLIYCLLNFDFIVFTLSE